MSKHTPAPWKLVFGNKERQFNEISVRPVNPCIKGVALPIAKVYRRDATKDSGGCGYANAALIAAAPEMYSLLNEIYQRAYGFRKTSLIVGTDEIKALLLKIEGAQ